MSPQDNPDDNSTRINSPWMTTAEAAAYLRYEGPSSLLELVRRGTIEPDGRRGKGAYLWRRETLDEWLRECARSTRPTPQPERDVSEDGHANTPPADTRQAPQLEDVEAPSDADSQSPEDSATDRKHRRGRKRSAAYYRAYLRNAPDEEE